MSREATQDTDRELVDAIKNGRPERFSELVERYEGKLYTFGLRMCGDAQDAEDMVQDTFLNVYKYLGGFRGEAKFKNWLYRVATSACSKKKRKSKYAPERELSLEEFYPQEGVPLPTEVPAWACAPLETLLNRELGEVLQDTILELPESYRLVLVLRDLEGFSTAETAEILGLSASNVKVRLHRARLFLRENLKDYFDNDACIPSQ
jgi:RNA polymerase sigma-70 factor (ECF subfamily)